jgi:site-specific recombinase XerD
MEKILLHQFAEKLELLGYSKRIIVDYPAYLRLFFEYLQQEEDIHSVQDITAEHISSYHSYLQYQTHTSKEKYLSCGTVCVRLQAVKSFYRVMHAEKGTIADLSAAVLLPKRKDTLPRHVPTELELKTLLESIIPGNPITTRDRALLELLYATGIRNEEVRSCSCDNLDLNERTLFVTGKGSKDRVVPVGDWVIPYIREYLETSRPKLIHAKEPTGLLFVSKNGRMITNCNLTDAIRKYAKRISLEHRITPHSFRHACATHLLRAGADIRYVQELLGHSDLSSTQIYTKIDITFLKQAHRKYHPREQDDHASGT